MSTESYSTRGVYYFQGRVHCPLAGIGRRGSHDSNRLVLDDADTVVSIDREKRLIRVHNDRVYPDKHPIADFMFLANGTTASGGTTPFGIHLKIFKRGQKLSLDLHRHLRTSENLTAAEFEPFEVVVTGGPKEEKVLDEQQVRALVCKPSWALRLVRSIMALRDNLGAPGKTGAASNGRVADLSVGFGALGLEWMIARAELLALHGVPQARPGAARLSLAEQLREGAWELRLTAMSTRWLPEVVQRDLFLFGLDQLPLLARVRERGLARNETLAFRFEGGEGRVLLGDQSTELPGALDVARAYLEFHMLGGLLCDQVERRAAAAR
jgi:hypothetical protein